MQGYTRLHHNHASQMRYNVIWSSFCVGTSIQNFFLSLSKMSQLYLMLTFPNHLSNETSHTFCSIYCNHHV